MRSNRLLLNLGILSSALFIVFSFLVALELWSQFDFDSMVKLQDKIPHSWDATLSLFSVLGGAEVTCTIALFLAIITFFKKNLIASLGWLGIIPATIIEVLGKLSIYHPAPSIEFLRTIKTTNLPNFYVHTEYSYPSGHVTRTAFLVVLGLIVVWAKLKNPNLRIIYSILLGVILFLMILSRVSLGEHWLSDVIGGILLGSSAAFFASLFVLKKKS